MARRGDGDDDLVVRPATPRDGVAGEEELIAVGRRRRPPAWLLAAGACVLVAGVVAFAVAKNAEDHKATLPSPSSSATVRPVQPARPTDRPTLPLGQLGPAADLALADDGTLFVLGQNGLMRVGHSGTHPEVSTTAVPPGAPALLAIDSGARRVWAVGRYSDSVFSYDADSLARVGPAQLRPYAEISAIAAQHGRLFLATTSGVYELDSPSSAARRLPGFSGAVQAIAADPGRHRLLAVAADHSLLDIRGGRVHVAPRSSTEVLIDSLLVTDDGVWAVGFGTRAGGTRVASVNPDMWHVIPVGLGDADAPQGAQGWPGGSVFWVRDAYSDTVVCYDAGNGIGAAEFQDLAPAADAPDPSMKVVSRPGVAYAISEESVVRLETTQACPG